MYKEISTLFASRTVFGNCGVVCSERRVNGDDAIKWFNSENPSAKPCSTERNTTPKGTYKADRHVQASDLVRSVGADGPASPVQSQAALERLIMWRCSIMKPGSYVSSIDLFLGGESRATTVVDCWWKHGSDAIGTF